MVERGLEGSEIQVIAPGDGGMFFGFADPDGNTWAVQEITARARSADPGRGARAVRG